ncbi:MAG: site-specific integrase [Treponema sp.]|nr:site-specific integrase [Treponema sp.]
MQKELFTDFCIRFWQDNLAYSQTTLAYRRDKIKCIELYAVPYFKSIYIEEITPKHITGFIMYLSRRQTAQYSQAEQQGIRYQKNHFLSRGSIRIIRTAVSQPLFYALKHKLNTHAGAWKLACRVQRQGEREYYYDGMVAPRDIFTIEELDALTASDWHNERAYMMFLVARYTGMRCGELRALRIQDIHAEYIQIHHAYNSIDGLKCTKNGSRRRFPIFAQLYRALREYLATLPESLTYSGECYVFPSFIKRGTPVGAYLS